MLILAQVRLERPNVHVPPIDPAELDEAQEITEDMKAERAHYINASFVRG